jgi:hypothetical protein
MSKMKHIINQKIQLLVAKRCFGKITEKPQAISKLCYFKNIKVVYNRIPKNANTSTVALLYQLDRRHKTINSISHNKIKKYCSRSAAFAVTADTSSYNKMVIIRDPYTRLLSAFLDKFGNKRGQYIDRYGDFSASPNGFSDFVNKLGVIGVASNGHWDLQISQMAYPIADYDYIVKFESLHHDLRKFVNSKNLDSRHIDLKQQPKSDAQKRTGSDELFDEYYNRDLVNIVHELYQEDFSTLGYKKRVIL